MTKPSLSQAIARASHWTLSGEVIKPHGMPPQEEIDSVYTQADCDALDARLYPVLRFELGKGSRKPINGSSVRMAMSHWRNPCLAVPLAQPSTQHPSHFHVRAFSYFWSNGIVAKAGVRHYVLYATPEDIEYAWHEQASRMVVPLDWLNTTFPDWYARYQVAIGLDVGMEELLTHVFSSSPKPDMSPVTLPEIFF